MGIRYKISGQSIEEKGWEKRRLFQHGITATILKNYENNNEYI